MEKIKVRINSDGITAREVNPLKIPEGGRNKLYDSTDTSEMSQKYHRELHVRRKEYQEAESKLRTFEIERVESEDGNNFYITYKWDYSKIYSAEIIDKEKLIIRIV